MLGEHERLTNRETLSERIREADEDFEATREEIADTFHFSELQWEAINLLCRKAGRIEVAEIDARRAGFEPDELRVQFIPMLPAIA